MEGERGRRRKLCSFAEGQGCCPSKRAVVLMLHGAAWERTITIIER